MGTPYIGPGAVLDPDILSKGFSDDFYIPNDLGVAAGDLPVFTAAGLPSVISVGDDGTLLTADPTAPEKMSYQHPNKGSALSIKNFQAKADCVVFPAGASVTSGSTTVTITAHGLTAADNGKSIIVALGAAGSVDLVTTITYLGVNTLTMAAAAGATKSGMDCAIGTDNSPIMNQAITWALLADRPVFVPSGSYLLATQAYSNTAMTKGVEILGDSNGQSEFVKGYDDGSLSLFRFEGQTIGSTAVLTANSVAGQQTLTVDSTANMKVGYYLEISDSSQQLFGEIGKVLYSIMGEVARVQTIVDSTHVTLCGRMEIPIAAATSKIVIHKPCSGFAIKDIKLTNPTPRTQKDGTHWFDIVNAQDLVIDNVKIKDTDCAVFRLQSVYNFMIDRLWNLDAHDSTTALPYIVALAQTTCHGRISNSYSRNGRHLVSSLPSSTKPAPAHILISDCIATEHTSQPFDMHPGTRHVVFDNCYTHASSTVPLSMLSDGTSTNGDGSGFQLRGPDMILRNCTAVGAFHGVDIYNGADRAQVINCKFIGCDQGVYIRNSTDFKIDNVDIINPITTGLRVETTDAAWAGWVTKGRVRNCRVDGDPSDYAFRFNTWHNNFDVDNLQATDATRKSIGMSAKTLATAATLTLPEFGREFGMTGTTNITAMTVHQHWAHRMSTLLASTSFSMTSGTGLVVKNGTVNLVSGDSITFVCDGVTWTEVSRKVVEVIHITKGSATSRNTTTTVTSDPDLTVSTLIPGVTYKFKLCIIHRGDGTTGDLKGALTLPSGATAKYAVNVPATNTASGVTVWTNNGRYIVNAGTFPAGNIDTSTDDISVCEGVIIMGANAGTVAFQWAQNGSIGTDTTVQAGSFWTFERVVA